MNVGVQSRLRCGFELVQVNHPQPPIREDERLTALNTRALGSSALEITSVGFGAWSIGGASWAYDGGDERDRTSHAALMHAWRSGVTWVDTAPMYGQGHSEELVGRAARVLGSDRPLIFTKCGRRWDSAGSDPYSDLRPASLRSDCEASLTRLGVDAIDLLQIHWPEKPERTRLEESWAVMRRLVEEGKIRAAGVSNFDVALLDRCEAIGHVDSLQIPFSLIVRDAGGGLLQWCAEHGTAVLAYSPMVIGLLTDKFKAEAIDAMHPHDWRRRHPEFQSPRLERNLLLRDALCKLATERGTTVAAVAVAWVLSWPQVTGAIVGASTPEQVDGWLPAAGITLGEDELDVIAESITQSGAGSGPVRPPQARTTRT
jgi:aryl-alcohol dehydrogenase-like predicted oxidoreductase